MLKLPTRPITIIGFDFGLKYIGVAVGQSVTQHATPLTTLRAQNGIPKWMDIQTLITEWNPQALIVGLPLNVDGSVQPITYCARRFMNRLYDRFKIPTYPVDERFSSWEAKYRTATKKTSDLKHLATEQHAWAAAVLIEQWFLESLTEQ